MDAITCHTPIFVLKTDAAESNSTDKKYKTCKSGFCPKKAEVKTKDDLILASVMIDLMSATMKQLGKQVRSLQKENTELHKQLDLVA